SQPYLAKAQDIDKTLNKLWENKKVLDVLERDYLTAPTQVQTLLANDLNRIRATAPSSSARRLKTVMAQAKDRPSQKEIAEARKAVLRNPFDIDEINRLRKLENQVGREVMVAYLDHRISDLKRRF